MMKLDLSYRQACALKRLLDVLVSIDTVAKAQVKYYNDGSSIEWDDGKTPTQVHLEIPEDKEHE